jgi:hypothetical protein
MAKQFALDYIDVAERIVEFRTKHPEGSLQQVSLDFKEVAGGWWVVYTAAAYRTPEDPRPGIGTAWEPVPGKTNFTRDSELQNAETAAWGRAIVAALAADTKRGIASAEEVRNRQADQVDPVILAKVAVKAAWEKGDRGPFDATEVAAHFQDWSQGEFLNNVGSDRLKEYADWLSANPMDEDDSPEWTI